MKDASHATRKRGPRLGSFIRVTFGLARFAAIRSGRLFLSFENGRHFTSAVLCSIESHSLVVAVDGGGAMRGLCDAVGLAFIVERLVAGFSG